LIGSPHIVPSYRAGDPVTRTQIISYQTTSKGSWLNQLLRLFNLKPISINDHRNSPIAFKLIIGPDFDTCKPTALIAFLRRHPRRRAVCRRRPKVSSRR
jgi:hypothetical protein